MTVVELKRFVLWGLGAGFVLLMTGCGPFGGSPGLSPGTIVFGTGIHRVSAYQFVVKNPRTTFRDGQIMGWVAELRRPAGSTSVTIAVLDMTLKKLTYEHLLSGVNPKWVQFAKSLPVDAFVKVSQSQGGTLPATYKLELLHGRSVLAAGTFKVTR